MNDTATYYTHARKEIVPFLPMRFARVLEIGCGQGGFRANLPTAKEYWGIELSAAAVGAAAQRLDRVFLGTFEQNAAHVPDRYFDLVVCNDVIEHMSDHDGFLAGIQRKMQDGAYLVGSVPNVRYLSNLQGLLLGKDWRYEDDGVLDRTHQRFFTHKSLARTLLQHDFEIERLSGINDGFRGGGRLQRALDRLLTLALGSDVPYLQIAFRARRGRPSAEVPVATQRHDAAKIATTP